MSWSQKEELPLLENEDLQCLSIAGGSSDSVEEEDFIVENESLNQLFEDVNNVISEDKGTRRPRYICATDDIFLSQMNHISNRSTGVCCDCSKTMFSYDERSRIVLGKMDCMNCHKLIPMKKFRQRIKWKKCDRCYHSCSRCCQDPPPNFVLSVMCRFCNRMSSYNIEYSSLDMRHFSTINYCIF